MMGDPIIVKHRSASGRLDSCWEYDPARRAVDVVFRLGGAEPVAFRVDVCALEAPRANAYPVMRVDAETWRILPSMFVWGANARGRDGVVQIARAIDESLELGMQVLLSNAPRAVAWELEQLA